MNKFNLIAIILLLQHQTHFTKTKTTLISTTEEIFNRTKFKHIINSNHCEEQFFVNEIPVLEHAYYQQLYEAEQIERNQKRKLDAEQRRQKIQFAAQAQNKITAKIILNSIGEIEKILPKLQHSILADYLLFSSETIPSRHEFDELIKIISYIKKEIPKLINTQDIERLEFYEKKLSCYPEKLELLFRISIDDAIEKSDSTSNLKELLKLVAEE